MVTEPTINKILCNAILQVARSILRCGYGRHIRETSAEKSAEKSAYLVTGRETIVEVASGDSSVDVASSLSTTAEHVQETILIDRLSIVFRTGVRYWCWRRSRK